MEPFTAVYSEERVIVPAQSEADSLLQDGYGYRRNGTHILTPVETLYNIERSKITVINENTNKTLSFQEILHLMMKDNSNLWTDYIVFKDLRTRGFIIETDKDGFKVYERGTYRTQPPSYLITTISEGKPVKIKTLITELRATEKNGLSVKIAVVDRRGEIVYYSLDEKELKLR